MASIKQRSFRLRERLFAGLTAVALHALVCFAVLDEIVFSYSSRVGTGFVPAQRPGRGYFPLFHGLVLPLYLTVLPPFSDTSQEGDHLVAHLRKFRALQSSAVYL